MRCDSWKNPAFVGAVARTSRQAESGARRSTRLVHWPSLSTPEEGEPGVFKDRALLGLRADRFVEGLAIAQNVLAPEVTVVFINGAALPARESLERALATHASALSEPVRIVAGGGGYVLGEESVLLNALEGRKPVPRLRPPLPVVSGYFGMPTVINNVETIANLHNIFSAGVEASGQLGWNDAPAQSCSASAVM